MNSSTLKFLGRFTVSLFLLGFILRSVDLLVFWQLIFSIDMFLVILPILLFFPSQLLAAYRWYFVLKQLQSPPPFWSLLRYNVLGQFSALFLPGQISGDIVRTLAITNGQHGKATYVLSVMIDKFVLLTAIATLAILGTIHSATLSSIPYLYPAALSLFITGLVAVLILSRYRSNHQLNRLLKYLGFSTRLQSRFLPRVTTKTYIPSITFRAIGIALIFGLTWQLLNALGSLLLARSFHIVINPIDWIAINAVVSLIQVLPISVGGLGVRESTFVSLLALYGVQTTQATAFSLFGFVIVAILVALSWILIGSNYIQRHRYVSPTQSKTFQKTLEGTLLQKTDPE